VQRLHVLPLVFNFSSYFIAYESAIRYQGSLRLVRQLSKCYCLEVPTILSQYCVDLKRLRIAITNEAFAFWLRCGFCPVLADCHLANPNHTRRRGLQGELLPSSFLETPPHDTSRSTAHDSEAYPKRKGSPAARHQNIAK
jgi:hypothetical protein